MFGKFIAVYVGISRWNTYHLNRKGCVWTYLGNARSTLPYIVPLPAVSVCFLHPYVYFVRVRFHVDVAQCSHHHSPPPTNYVMYWRRPFVAGQWLPWLLYCFHGNREQWFAVSSWQRSFSMAITVRANDRVGVLPQTHWFAKQIERFLQLLRKNLPESINGKILSPPLAPWLPW